MCESNKIEVEYKKQVHKLNTLLYYGKYYGKQFDRPYPQSGVPFTQIDYTLTHKYLTRVEVAVSDKHTSLLQYELYKLRQF